MFRILWHIVKSFVTVTLVVGLGIYALDRYISYSTQSAIYAEVKNVPHKRAALLLGTAKYVAKGKKNYFYVYRINAAVALWKAGKVDAIVVSGDNASKYYNETIRMQKDLIKAGVPKKYIALDYAGFRTLDSILRAESIFDLKEYTVISQRFHLERALYLAKNKGQNVIGFAAKDIAGTKAARKMALREYFTRLKAFLDVHILDTKATIMDDKVKVKYRK
ncbi:MAG: ElyC/SanA/YdcF family protein [Sulfurovum sp.]|nr:ElyC/SanA/YdcF family protein [Sulfurovum sp.]